MMRFKRLAAAAVVLVIAAGASACGESREELQCSELEQMTGWRDTRGSVDGEMTGVRDSSGERHMRQPVSISGRVIVRDASADGEVVVLCYGLRRELRWVEVREADLK